MVFLKTVILSAALATAQTPEPTPAPNADLSWMAGYWLDCSGGREASETWSDPRGGLMVGHAVTLSQGRASFEAAHIGPTPDGLAYFAQPDGAPATAFALIESGADRAVFANPTNDFPTRVIYERTDDTLTARIEGEIEGQARSMEWRFDKAMLNARCPA